MIERFAIVLGEDVVNICLWDPEAEPDWRPGEGEAVPCPDHVGPGWTYRAGAFAPPPPEPAET